MPYHVQRIETIAHPLDLLAQCVPQHGDARVRCREIFQSMYGDDPLTFLSLEIIGFALTLLVCSDSTEPGRISWTVSVPGRQPFFGSPSSSGQATILKPVTCSLSTGTAHDSSVQRSWRFCVVPVSRILGIRKAFGTTHSAWRTKRLPFGKSLTTRYRTPSGVFSKPI
jgi:hypothetical protein